MTVEINYAIVTLSDWLKHFATDFQPMRIKQNLNQSHLVRAIFPALSATYRGEP